MCGMCAIQDEAQGAMTGDISVYSLYVHTLYVHSLYVHSLYVHSLYVTIVFKLNE
jgi:hypothetical protein